MAAIPEAQEDLLLGTDVATLAVLTPEGFPLVTPVWVDYDGEFVLVNSVDGRKKVEFMRETPRVGLCVVDSANTSRYLSIVGDVAEMTYEGAVAHVHRLASHYRGVEEYPYLDRDDGDRILVKIRPRSVYGSVLDRTSEEIGFSRRLDG